MITIAQLLESVDLDFEPGWDVWGNEVESDTVIKRLI